MGGAEPVWSRSGQRSPSRAVGTLLAMLTLRRGARKQAVTDLDAEAAIDRVRSLETQIAALQADVKALQADLQQERRLHRRLAELTDTVETLLVAGAAGVADAAATAAADATAVSTKAPGPEFQSLG